MFASVAARCGEWMLFGLFSIHNPSFDRSNDRIFAIIFSYKLFALIAEQASDRAAAASDTMMGFKKLLENFSDCLSAAIYLSSSLALIIVLLLTGGRLGRMSPQLKWMKTTMTPVNKNQVKISPTSGQSNRYLNALPRYDNKCDILTVKLSRNT